METIKRIATRGPVEEYRDMNVGDVVRFPLDKYNYNTLRVLPSTSLVPDRVDGKSWKTRINYPEKAVDVTRVS